MNDDALDPEMALMVTAADLRLGHEEAIAMLERLANTFELTLPDHTEVKRGGWFFSSTKPIEGLQLTFDEVGFELVKDGNRKVRACVQKRVRGVVLKSTEVTLDAWTDQVAEALSQLAAHNATARSALAKLTRG